MNALATLRCIRSLTLLLCALLALDAQAQRLGTFNRITTPNGRQVLELRQGMHPANSRLLFTAAITAGPTGGTTSLLLQQALVGDIFNQNAPAAGWTVVRSTATAFSLGGGCGRSNLIDFPFINNNRPEILRITGTTHQVITLGIAGNDQYDSIDCRTQPNGRVLYMLTNRTRSRLEFRREQGGLLQLVRDNFGVVATPFRGGVRPSFNIFYRRPTAQPSEEPGGASTTTVLGSPPVVETRSVVVLERVGAGNFNSVILVIVYNDDDELVDAGECTVTQRPDTGGFDVVREMVALSTAVAGNVTGVNTLNLFRIFDGRGSDAPFGGCSVQPPQSLGSAGPFQLYTFAGLTGTEGYARNGLLFQHDLVVAPNQVIINDGVSQDVQPNPFGNRGGPASACGMSGTELETGALLSGPGASGTQVQQSVVKGNLSGILFGTGMEEELDGIDVHCDPQIPR